MNKAACSYGFVSLGGSFTPAQIVQVTTSAIKVIMVDDLGEEHSRDNSQSSDCSASWLDPNSLNCDAPDEMKISSLRPKYMSPA